MRRLMWLWLLVLACDRGERAPAAAPGQAASTPASKPALANEPPPPALEPITHEEWLSRVETYRDRARSLDSKQDLAAHGDLAAWAFEHGLEDEAWEQWRLVLAIDRNDTRARKATGWVQSGATWKRPTRPNPAWLAKVKRAGRAYSFKVAIQADVDRAFLGYFGDQLQRVNRFIWRITEGQVFLDEIELVDKEPDGRFVVPAELIDKTLIDGGGAFCANPGTPEWKVVTAGRVYVRIIAHEFLHGIFGLPDERHGCSCLMQGGLYGIRTDQLQLCDADTHRPDDVVPTSCWESILSRDPSLVHPNRADYGGAPEVRIKIVDR